MDLDKLCRVTDDALVPGSDFHMESGETYTFAGYSKRYSIQNRVECKKGVPVQFHEVAEEVETDAIGDHNPGIREGHIFGNTF